MLDEQNERTSKGQLSRPLPFLPFLRLPSSLPQMKVTHLYQNLLHESKDLSRESERVLEGEDL